MARQNIQFKGLRHTPSDITGQDGDLLECVNLIHENGELKPIELPDKTTMNGVYSNETLVAVHNLTDGKKYVYAVWNTSTTLIHVKNENGDVVLGHGLPGQEIKWADTIGNTLIIGTDKSTHYALYKNGQYKWLGDKLPQPVFWFDMESNTNASNDQFINIYEPNPPCEFWNSGDQEMQTLDGGGIPVIAVFPPGSGTTRLQIAPHCNTKINQNAVRDNLLSKIAEATNRAKKKGLFLYPFFVRYAVRMFDGNYAMHSAPILMLPSTDGCPIAAKIGNIASGNGAYQGLWGNIGVQTKAKALKYKFKGFVDDSGNPVDASDWDDIIRGVDIFLSSEVVTFDEGYYDLPENIFESWYWHEGSSSTGGTYNDNSLPYYGNAYVEDNIKETWLQNHKSNLTVNGATSPYLDCMLPLHLFSARYISEKLAETNLFYKVKQYDLSALNGMDGNTYLFFQNETDRGVLERLETLPTLPDDYVSRSRMVGSANYNYNQRLILGNISLQAPLWYQDAKTFKKNYIFDADIVFEIEKPEKTIYVGWSWDDLGKYDFGHYLFYPDPDCKRAYIVSDYDGIINMQEHSGLHGAFALMPDLKSLYETLIDVNDSISLPTPSTDRYYSLQNTIAMSSVANPFYFPASNFKDIGRAKVIGIAANMLDVSSAQWGQYPIYVFCSDGIIAVMIDGEGKMGGIQAVSADVLREPRGLSQPTLIQTGQALMFLTQRGVMAIAGTKVSCISNDMKGRHYNPMRELAGIDYRVGAFANLITRTCDDVAFDEFASVGFLAYDYAHHRVLLLSIGKDYQYVYSLNSGLWSKQIIYADRASYQIDQIPSNVATPQRDNPILKVKPISAAVNNYTEMYLQDTDGYLYRTMVVQAENSLKQLYQYGYFISRPIRFGTDEYKSLVRTLHRYTHFANVSFVKMAVYGSRDGVKYGRLNTLRGMSYKYFIFAIYTYLMPNERYSYLSVDFETRLNNKLR